MDAELHDRLERFAALIAGSPHNLVSRAARAELTSRHIPEAVSFAGSLPGPGRLLDLGSGGGLPGMVIAAVRPDLEVHLLDATAKKVAFLEDAATALGLTVTVHHGRAEDLGRTGLRGRFDVVTARAVAPLDRLVALAAPFLTTGGTLHALKGDRWRQELEDAATAIRRCGLRLQAVPEDDGPDGSGTPGPGATSDGPRPRVVVLART